MNRSEAQQESKPRVIPTGVPALDEALGIGGYPRGRVTEIFGPKAGERKMGLILSALREAQRIGGGMPAFVDPESAFNPRVAQVTGVDCGGLMLSQPESIEEGLHTVESLTRSGACHLIVVGSLAALVDGDELGGMLARSLSASLRKLTASCHKTGTAIVFVTHRESRVAHVQNYADMAKLEPLGSALKFYSSVRIDVRAGDEGRTVAKVVKNKLAAPFRKAEWS